MPFLTLERVKGTVPNDCDMILLDERGLSPKKRFLNKEEANQFKRDVRNKCPCQQGRKKCPVQTRKCERFSTLHAWFDGHGQTTPNWPFKNKYPCDGPCAAYRHCHRTWDGRRMAFSNLRRTDRSKRRIKKEAVNDTMEEDDFEHENTLESNSDVMGSKTEEIILNFQRVPEEVPNDCDAVAIGSLGSKLLKKEEVGEFKKKILQSCPCQDEMGSCPLLDKTDYNISTVFDVHSKKIKTWPYKLKYVCIEPRIGFRHYHTQEYERANCRLFVELS